MPTQAKKEGNARHIAKLDVIKIQPYREEGAAIRAAAKDANQSVQGYILQAVRERMERERAGVVPADTALSPGVPRMSKETQEEQGQGAGGAPAGADVPSAGRSTADDGGGRFPYFSDGERTPQPTVGSSPMEDEKISPAEEEEDEKDLPWF